jgi:hypothetical protein
MSYIFEFFFELINMSLSSLFDLIPYTYQLGLKKRVAQYCAVEVILSANLRMTHHIIYPHQHYVLHNNR